ncbi:MAG: GNAT family N-acetyltransferase [candidate division Zixibacteria bacterium]|nr:GNAT family N-acetyltransferase [candidate division Zixibacteria bacterium]
MPGASWACLLKGKSISSDAVEKMGLAAFLGRVADRFRQGKYAYGFHLLAGELPDWLIAFNKALLLKTDSPHVTQSRNSSVRVRIAADADVDAIARMGGLSHNQTAQMMVSGAICFLAVMGDSSPLAYTWSAYGRCYIRGIAFEYDFSDDIEYSYFNRTKPEARRKGLFQSLKAASIEYAAKKGIRSFSALVEFTNQYSLSLHEKMGYEPFLEITFLKVLFVKVCHIRDLTTGKSSLQLRLRQPRGKVTII